MDVIDVIKGRKSCRAFSSDPVSKELIEEMLSLATQALLSSTFSHGSSPLLLEKERLDQTLGHREKQISCGPGNVKPCRQRW
jgi:nitroreductase